MTETTKASDDATLSFDQLFVLVKIQNGNKPRDTDESREIVHSLIELELVSSSVNDTKTTLSVTDRGAVHIDNLLAHCLPEKITSWR